MRKLLVILLLPTAVVHADTIEMKVYGLVCGFCAQGIEKALRRNPATEDVVVSLEHQLVAVATKEGRDIADEELEQALTGAGYDVRAIRRSKTTLEEIRERLSAERQ